MPYNIITITIMSVSGQEDNVITSFSVNLGIEEMFTGLHFYTVTL